MSERLDRLRMQLIPIRARHDELAARRAQIDTQRTALVDPR